MYNSSINTLYYDFHFFRFEKLVTYQKQNGEYQIDYKKFHSTYSVNTPRCSAKELDLMTVSRKMFPVINRMNVVLLSHLR